MRLGASWTGSDWLQYGRRIGTPSEGLARDLPDVLVVGTARAGTTWLFEQLRRHPQIVIPDVKEVRYFDAYWRVHAIDWYCAQFRRAPGTIACDISPTYALLPSFAIKHIARLKPGLKILIILREPIARAWSHLKHTFKVREANFEGDARSFEQLTVDDLVRNLVHDFTLNFGDYAKIVERWTTSFPLAQIHLAYYETIFADPRRFFAHLFGFLGVDAVPMPFVAYPFEERPNASRATPWPVDLSPWLTRLFVPRRHSMEPWLRRIGFPPPWPAISHCTEVGPAQLPELLPDYAIDLVDGRFRARRLGSKRADWPLTRWLIARTASNIGELGLRLNRAHRAALLDGGSKRISIEDWVLARALDGVPARVADSERDREFIA